MEDRQRRGYPNRALPKSDPDRNTFGYGNSYCTANSDCYCYFHTYAYCYGYGYRYRYRYCDSNSNSDSYSYSNSWNPDSDTNMHAGRDLVRHFERFWYRGE
jgi:hypothetical protein